QATGGTLSGQFAAQNGATVKDLQFGRGPGDLVLFTGGSTLGLQDPETAPTDASLVMSLSGGTVTINGTGTLLTLGSIDCIDSTCQSGLGVDLPQMGSGYKTGVLFGGRLALPTRRSSDLQATGGTLSGQFAAQNGATVKDLQFGRGPGDLVILTAGSTLGI